MENLKKILETIIDTVTTNVSNGLATIATTEMSSYFLKKIKGFFKGNGKVPLETRETISSLDLGDEIKLSELKEILSLVPDEIMESWVDTSDNRGSVTEIATARNGGTVTIQGDVAGRDIYKR